MTPSPPRAGKASIRESPVRRPARRILHWALRVLLALGGAEIALWAVSWGLARFGGTTHGSGRGGEILCAGDSCTFGIGAPRDRSYPDQLRELFAQEGDAREVVNLGQPGFSSRQILDRLERAVGRSPSSYVLFLGGANDAARSDLFLEGRRGGVSSPFERAIGLLRRLRTVRVLEAAWRKLAGADPFPARAGLDPADVSGGEWDAAVDRTAAEGGDLLPWLAHAWSSEDIPRIERTLNLLSRSPDFETLRSRLPFPFEVYEWELAMLRG
ncbi:MAG TPA: GDSL-type esterase/lipase family protein, partial [Planctomycetota bacterium]|nr:GDSL-type esterase/lipase family protein [Planctomycetota bacterium]